MGPVYPHSEKGAPELASDHVISSIDSARVSKSLDTIHVQTGVMRFPAQANHERYSMRLHPRGDEVKNFDAMLS